MKAHSQFTSPDCRLLYSEQEKKQDEASLLLIFPLVQLNFHSATVKRTFSELAFGYLKLHFWPFLFAVLSDDDDDRATMV